MIYLQEKLNLTPATPARLDEFIDFAREGLVPGFEKHHGRLVAAWFSNIESFFQVSQIWEFEDLNSFDKLRLAATTDEQLIRLKSKLDTIAPSQQHSLFAPLAESYVDILHDAIDESRRNPCRSYNLAILQVVPGRMHDMVAGLTAVAENRNLPIVMSWRHIAGNPNEIIDLWKGSLSRPGYQNSVDAPFDETWWTNLRALAPHERLVAVDTLPYSPLQ